MTRMRVSFSLLLLLTISFGDVFSASQLAGEEAEDYYQKWLKQDVVYIITADERDVFLKLQTDAERDHFIEQFWRRRDPDPTSQFNEFKEEHYRRIQYSNEHFTAGLAGWRTDRGMIYIKFGPPNDIDDHPAGSTYVRPKHEGGGTTLVNPFQVWRYNYIEGVGSDIEIEFVDTYGGNLYRFANDELEKDALLYHPIGLTISEQLMGGDKTERIITRHFGDQDAKLENQIGRTSRAKDAPFERMRVLKDLESPPTIKYRDLRRIVTTNIRYTNLPFQAGFSFFSVTGDRKLITVTISVKDSELTFEPLPGGVQRATLALYGMITNLSGQILREFEDSVVRDKSKPAFLGTSLAQRKLLLSPGRYKLSLVVKDGKSGKVGTGDYSLIVPSFKHEFTSSSMVLATSIVKAHDNDSGQPMVMNSGYKVTPNLAHAYQRGEELPIYLELYNYSLDQASSQPVLKVDSEIQKDGLHWERSDLVLDASFNHHELLKDRLLVLKKLSTAEMDPGDYRLVMTFRDELSGVVTVAASDFKVLQ